MRSAVHIRVPLVRKHCGIGQGPLKFEVVMTVWKVKATRQTPTLPTHILVLRKIVTMKLRSGAFGDVYMAKIRHAFSGRELVD